MRSKSTECGVPLCTLKWNSTRGCHAQCHDPECQRHWTKPELRNLSIRVPGGSPVAVNKAHIFPPPLCSLAAHSADLQPGMHAPLVLLDQLRPHKLTVSQMLPLERLRPSALLADARGLLRAAPEPNPVLSGCCFPTCSRGAAT